MNAGSFLTDSQQDALGNVFFNLHATYARPIIIWKTARKTVILSNPANSYIFDNAPFNDDIQVVPVSGLFQARILYGKQQPLEQFSTPQSKEATDQINIRNEKGIVRIQVDATGASYLFDAKQVTFDNEIFDIDATQRPHGIFSPKFYTFYLTKLN